MISGKTTNPFGLPAIVTLSNGDRVRVTRADNVDVVFDCLGALPETTDPVTPETVIAPACGVTGGVFVDLAAVIAQIENPPAVALPVPKKVGPAQLRIALRRLQPSITSTAVHEVIDMLPTVLAQDDARDLWDYATEIRRDHPVLAGLAAAFGLTGDQVDDVFRFAAAI